MSGFQGGAMTLGSNSGIQFQQNMAMINSLRKSLNLAIQQNSTLKSRLKKIYLDADITDIPEVSGLNFLNFIYLWCIKYILSNMEKSFQFQLILSLSRESSGR